MMTSTLIEEEKTVKVTVYHTLIRLNIYNNIVQRMLNDPHYMHRFIMHGTDYTRADNDFFTLDVKNSKADTTYITNIYSNYRSTFNILYALSTSHPGELRIKIQSTTPLEYDLNTIINSAPFKTTSEQYYCAPLHTLLFHSPLNEPFTPEKSQATYTFTEGQRILINTRMSMSKTITQPMGKIEKHIHSSMQPHHAYHSLKRIGIHPPTPNDIMITSRINQKSDYITQRHANRTTKHAHEGFQIHSAIIQTHGIIVDVNKFASTFITGLGSKKAYGCGLIHTKG